MQISTCWITKIFGVLNKFDAMKEDIEPWQL